MLVVEGVFFSSSFSQLPKEREERAGRSILCVVVDALDVMTNRRKLSGRNGIQDQINQRGIVIPNRQHHLRTEEMVNGGVEILELDGAQGGGHTE